MSGLNPGINENDHTVIRQFLLTKDGSFFENVNFLFSGLTLSLYLGQLERRIRQTRKSQNYGIVKKQ